MVQALRACASIVVIAVFSTVACSPMDAGVPVDFGVLQGEITNYPVKCEVDLVSYRCPMGQGLPLNPTTYKVYVKEQMVVGTTAGFVSKFTRCAIASRSSWACEWETDEGKFGFREGQFFDTSESELMQEEWRRVFYVSPPEYLEYRNTFGKSPVQPATNGGQ
jgi:hypothetical protein